MDIRWAVTTEEGEGNLISFLAIVNTLAEFRLFLMEKRRKKILWKAFLFRFNCEICNALIFLIENKIMVEMFFYEKKRNLLFDCDLVPC